MTLPSQRLAVVLMNLGGPDAPDAVEPFLRNLFSDPAIINLPGALRIPLAWIISRARAKKARKTYQYLGGGSPLLPNTKAQQVRLCQALQEKLPQKKVAVFIAMRYWHPFASETVAQVKAFCPDKIVLLPLYPQFSITTTGSSFQEWRKEAEQQGLKASTREIQCYPQNSAFIEAHVDLLRPWIKKASVCGTPRILFSAHGLPQKIINAGDPYEEQVRQTVAAILQKLPPDADGVICYQSKVGPLKWLGPSTEEELKRAGRDKVPVIVVPAAFVSEHVETLVELDEDYRRLAEKAGVPFYGRVAALGDHPAYIQALAEMTIANA